MENSAVSSELIILFYDIRVLTITEIRSYELCTNKNMVIQKQVIKTIKLDYVNDPTYFFEIHIHLINNYSYLGKDT